MRKTMLSQGASWLWSPQALWCLCALLSTLAVIWFTRTQQPIAPGAAQVINAPVLQSGDVATMDSAALRYSDGWRVSASGADPSEPADPWGQPSGVVSFSYSGEELLLALHPGDYWGYLFVTVDGQAANRLPSIAGNRDRQGLESGYRPLRAAETLQNRNATPLWVAVHHTPANSTLHQVRVEVWRGWGQLPLRGVAVDARSSAATWPGALAALGAFVVALLATASSVRTGPIRPLSVRTIPGALRLSTPRLAPYGFMLGMGLVGMAIGLTSWPLALAGAVIAGSASIVRPAFWLAALFFALPLDFAFSIPLLPGRAIGLVEFFLVGAILALAAHEFTRPAQIPTTNGASAGNRSLYSITVILALLTGWSLLTAFAAPYRAVALREWRSLFVVALLVALLLTRILRRTDQVESETRLLVYSWLAGATAVALAALWQHGAGAMLINAEGVNRVRGFYASPNNLALYLERTWMVTAAMAIFEPPSRRRRLWLAATLIQAVALIFTFSKGALFFGMPGGLATLAVGGLWMLRRQARPKRVLWALAVLTAIGLLILAPYLNTPRFRQILDFSQGTTYLRLQLWRSSWQMALDHWMLGVGPDNFLYIYRSEYILPTAWQEPNLNHPHNALLDWWTRLGIPGLLLGLAFWGRGLHALVQAFLSHGKERTSAALLLGILAASAAGLAHGLIDVSYALPDLMLLWVLFFVLGESLHARHHGISA